MYIYRKKKKYVSNKKLSLFQDISDVFTQNGLKVVGVRSLDDTEDPWLIPIPILGIFV